MPLSLDRVSLVPPLVSLSGSNEVSLLLAFVPDVAEELPNLDLSRYIIMVTV